MAAARNLKKSPFEIHASRLQISRGNFWEQLVRVTRMTDQAKKGLLIIYSELIVCNFFLFVQVKLKWQIVVFCD